MIYYDSSKGKEENYHSCPKTRTQHQNQYLLSLRVREITHDLVAQSRAVTEARVTSTAVTTGIRSATAPTTATTATAALAFRSVWVVLANIVSPSRRRVTSTAATAAAATATALTATTDAPTTIRPRRIGQRLWVACHIAVTVQPAP